jgi:hypothetical protein
MLQKTRHAVQIDVRGVGADMRRTLNDPHLNTRIGLGQAVEMRQMMARWLPPCAQTREHDRGPLASMGATLC